MTLDGDPKWTGTDVKKMRKSTGQGLQLQHDQHHGQIGRRSHLHHHHAPWTLEARLAEDHYHHVDHHRHQTYPENHKHNLGDHHSKHHPFGDDPFSKHPPRPHTAMACQTPSGWHIHVPKQIEMQTEKVLTELGVLDGEDNDLSHDANSAYFEKALLNHLSEMQMQLDSSHETLSRLVHEHIQFVHKLEAHNRHLQAQLQKGSPKNLANPSVNGVSCDGNKSPLQMLSVPGAVKHTCSDSQASSRPQSQQSGIAPLKRSNSHSNDEHRDSSNQRLQPAVAKGRRTLSFSVLPVESDSGKAESGNTAAPPTMEPDELLPLELEDLPGTVSSDEADLEAKPFEAAEAAAEADDTVAPFEGKQQKKSLDSDLSEMYVGGGYASEGSEDGGYEGQRRRTHFDCEVEEQQAPGDDALSNCSDSDSDEDEMHFHLLDVWEEGVQDMRTPNLVAFQTALSRDERKTNKMKNFALIKAATAAPVDLEERLHEERVPSRCQKMIWSPSSVVRLCWEAVGLMMVIYDIISIPLVLLDPPKNSVTTGIDWATRVFWTIDIPFTFMTAYMTANGNVVMHPQQIALHYIKSWFFLDLVLVATDWAELFWGGKHSHATGSARMGKVTRIFRIVRVVRLVRLARFKQFLKNNQTRLKSEGMLILLDIAKILIGVLASAHYVACAWYGIGNSGKDEHNSWLLADGYDRRPLEQRYLLAFHWSMAQFHGGMDEIVPVGVSERVYAVFISVLSWLAAAAFVSGLTSEMTRLHILASQQARQLSVLNRYLKQCRISDHLSIRVQRNAQHALNEQQRLMPECEVELLHLVSEALREELHFEMYSPVLEVHPFFAVYTSECPQVIRKVCHIAMSTLLISTGDVVFNAGEIPQLPKMYVVCSGTLDYIPLSGGDVIQVMTEHWLSEAVLWTPWMHRGVLKATGDGRLCLLDSLRFQEIVGCFDHSQNQIDPKQYASLYVKHLNKLLDLNQLDKITDMPDHEELKLVKMCYNMRHGSVRKSNIEQEFAHVAKRRRSAFMDGAGVNPAVAALQVKVMKMHRGKQGTPSERKSESATTSKSLNLASSANSLAAWLNPRGSADKT